MIAVPTTYAGSEQTPIYGLTGDRHKQTGRNVAVLPKAVIYDPELTVGLPPGVTGPSACNALAHSVEALWVPEANPVTTALALEGVRAIATALPAVMAEPGDLDARAGLLYGAYLSGVALASTSAGMHHKITHVLGGTFGLVHADTHSVVLPHVVAFNGAAVPAAMARLADALGAPGEDAAGALWDLARRRASRRHWRRSAWHARTSRRLPSGPPPRSPPTRVRSRLPTCSTCCTAPTTASGRRSRPPSPPPADRGAARTRPPGSARSGRSGRTERPRRQRRRSSMSSTVPAICSNGTRPRRSRPASSASSVKGVPMGLVDDAEFHFFHFFPYADLPDDHRRYESLWVDFSNANYDPQVGHQLYTRYLSEMVLADRLGYDGIVLNEHHNTQYSMNPAPNLTAAALIPQTSGWVSVFGTPPNLGYPNRLAEEYAMLDVMSGGRLRVAFPLGTGMEYWANAVNPATARARFRESIDIILRCWTDAGPQSYSGEFYTYRYLNPWPRPMQQPYPECYIVGTGSPETIELAAELGFGYTVVFIPTKVQLQVFDHYRERLAHHGHDPTPDKVTIGVMAYVAESDERAEEEFLPHVMYFFENNLRTTPRYLNPPGYVTVPEFRKRITGPTCTARRTGTTW